jgi:hypothetical protein
MLRRPNGDRVIVVARNNDALQILRPTRLRPAPQSTPVATSGSEP